MQDRPEEGSGSDIVFKSRASEKIPLLPPLGKFGIFNTFNNFNTMTLTVWSRKTTETGILRPPYNRCSSTTARATIITPEAVTATAVAAGANVSTPDHSPLSEHRSRKRPAYRKMSPPPVNGAASPSGSTGLVHCLQRLAELNTQRLERVSDPYPGLCHYVLCRISHRKLANGDGFVTSGPHQLT